MKKVTLITLFLMCLTFVVKAQSLSEQLVGSWDFVSISSVKAKNPAKQEAEQTKANELSSLLTSSVLVFKKDGTCTLVVNENNAAKTFNSTYQINESDVITFVKPQGLFKNLNKAAIIMLDGEIICGKIGDSVSMLFNFKKAK